MTIQIGATDSTSLSMMLYEVILTFPVCEQNPQHFKMNATEQYFPVLLFIKLYKVVLTFESVDENLRCDHSRMEAKLSYTFL